MTYNAICPDCSKRYMIDRDTQGWVEVEPCQTCVTEKPYVSPIRAVRKVDPADPFWRDTKAEIYH